MHLEVVLEEKKNMEEAANSGGYIILRFSPYVLVSTCGLGMRWVVAVTESGGVTESDLKACGPGLCTVFLQLSLLDNVAKCD